MLLFNTFRKMVFAFAQHAPCCQGRHVGIGRMGIATILVGYKIVFRFGLLKGKKEKQLLKADFIQLVALLQLFGEYYFSSIKHNTKLMLLRSVSSLFVSVAHNNLI